MPYLSVGMGEPLLFIPGLVAHNEPPTGTERRFHAELIMPFADDRRVWWVNRRRHLSPNVTMGDLAGQYAAAMRAKFHAPVDIIGTSTGGSIALQLAMDHPDVVRRLVIVSSAYRLSARGIDSQRRLANLLRARHRRGAGAEAMAMQGDSPVSERILRGVGWMLGPTVFNKPYSDVLATITAEEQFDVRDRLHEITAPTFVIGGSKDAYYSEQLFTETANLIHGARLAIYDGVGHGGIFGPRLVADVKQFLHGG
ncbi:hypothetical protein BHD05_04250 [Marisediminicola antarctica]|uniref:Serine aminopeptidase S33 domain-containing protein n=2 Tax=Marisediminicola antarctica TaxID=674079 RepID=A0A7L5ALK1_9MICO|nr:hypothetical protein BHD05_04250 [Marisediminicola antarctica]